MEFVVWIFSLYLLLTNYLIFKSAGETYCTTQTDQPGCTRKCHCVNSWCPAKGECPNYCSAGWMGEFCQYRNIANGSSTNVFTNMTVDLLLYYPVSALRINIGYTAYNPSFTNVRITVTNKTDEDGGICFHDEIKIESGFQDIFCSAIWFGSKLLIEMSNDLFRISSIQVFGGRNVALWRPATQSTDYDIYKLVGLASAAVDGKENIYSYQSGSCSHTQQENRPQWNVTLRRPFLVVWIQIDNRENFESRINGFKVESTGYKRQTTLYDDAENSRNGQRKIIYIDAEHSKLPAVLQNMTVFKSNQNIGSDDSVLTLCEVYLYACRPTRNGEDCESLCPVNCNDNGTCLHSKCSSCKPGWIGNQCNSVWSASKFCTVAQRRVCDGSFNCSCQFLCHCRNGQECDPLSGKCSNGCEKGWMGGSCQYANIAVNTSLMSDLQEGDKVKCETYNITIDLKKDYPLTALHVVTEGAVQYVNATVISSEGVQSHCESNVTAENKIVIIYCPYILKGRTIHVSSKLSKICKVEVYGGENIALWGNTEQSTTYQTNDVSWPANFAVDGIATTEFDAMPRSCSHTSDVAQRSGRAWWELCFRDVVFITRMKLFLRSSHSKRNQGIEVQLIDQDNGTISVYNTSTDLPKTVIELVHPAFIRKVIIHGGKTTQNDENILQICELQVFGCPYKGCDQLLQNCKKTIDNIDEDFKCKKCMAGWEGPFCNIRKTCNITDVEHLRITTREKRNYFYVNESVSFLCDNGYDLVGDSNLTCQENKTWNNHFPSCMAVNCTSPSQSSASHLQDGTGWTKIYHFGDNVTLSCDEGYQLFGHRNISCNEMGRWTPAFPICKVAASETSSDAQGTLPVPAIAGGGAAFLIVILVIVITIVFVRRRRQPNNKRAYQEPTPNLPDQNMYAEIDKTREKKEKKTTKDDGAGYYNLNAIDPSTARTARNEVYYDFTIPKKPSQFAVKVTDFIDYVDERKHQNDAFGQEFRKLKSGLQFPTTFAMRSKNTPKNKYRNIYPYDDSRVVLLPIEGKQDSDYINASYIHGSFEVKHYIAAQGPLQETLGDFWRMIWQEDVGKITMLTKLSEGRKVKCAQYWPEAGDPMEMGEITVKLIDTETFADFEIRTISVTKGKDNRNVIQFHFTSWPDKGIPTYASSLVHFRAKVLNTHSPRSGPILVHCSAGIGRTGTFIALDFLLQQAKDTGYVDVFTCVEMLRRQRVNMVQTQEQYMFVHVALLEALMTPSSAIGASDFPQHYRELLEYDGDTKTLKLENEFNTLNRTSPEIDDADFSQGKSSSRRKKNRYSNIIPVNGEMPIITPSSSEDQYINAVYLPAYREKNNFIITQMPLTNTIIDFWRLIHHQKVSTIVMLNTLDTKDENDLGVYWPKENGSETFGDFKVDIVNTSVDEDGDMEIVNLSYTYKEQEPRTVRLFKAIFWPEDMTTPSSIRAFLKLIDTANLHHQRTKSTPIIVHCINGCEKSGLYCVLQVVIERLKLDQDVGIQQIIKQMRSRRPQIIPNFEQFQFCHDVVIEFMKQYDAYSNFQ